MCGIVGYKGNQNCVPVLLNGLKSLEYRGYDSAGIAILDGEDILVRKAKGALKFLEEKIAGEVIKGAMGIGHTRWATHGEPSDINAHPHTNVSGTIAIVHNGIIENYADLKAWLQNQGVVFRSQTDTEVIAHLLNYYYEQEKDLFKALKLTLHRVEGSYALGVICKDYPDRIICARKESPLVVGLGKAKTLLHLMFQHFLNIPVMYIIWMKKKLLYFIQTMLIFSTLKAKKSSSSQVMLNGILMLQKRTAIHTLCSKKFMSSQRPLQIQCAHVL